MFLWVQVCVERGRAPHACAKGLPREVGECCSCKASPQHQEVSVDQRLVGFGQGCLKAEASNPVGCGCLGRVAGAEVVPHIPRS